MPSTGLLIEHENTDANAVQTTRAAIARLEALLAENGQLFVGYAEVPALCQHGFTPLQYPQSFGLKKEPARPAPAVKAAPKPTPRAVRGASPPHAPPRLTPTPTPAPAPSSTAVPPAADLLAEARHLADLGLLKAAEDRSRDHLAQAPDSAEAYFILGLVNELTDKPRLAEDYWKRCVYLQPDHYEALCHLALLAETNNDPGAAAALKARAARVYKRQQGS